MKQLKSAVEQLSLWSTREESPVTAIDEKNTDAVPIGDIDAMRAWLLNWGKRHGYPGFGFPYVYPPRNTDADRCFGSVKHGHEEWKRSLQPPYTQTETYPGEFLTKAIEQVKRYDAGTKIPWFEYELGRKPRPSSREEEE